ncbi:YaiO family outer membrane beta-barrel protein [Plebeiibacterium marinum]|uniref:YaiO family outer membrane beta-barrel protein n=1 Tax=Plebeiibacterium marinum TaxID=2992111 RepID=A0AAE3MA95_9BACT|nr:YaiO family outer membrane beta-barrel protein [Plebeiobacterium marinum]MCW3804171.1 YaiO family outer membrane beta-barrel protein [Plebeiobacterium marinum]
MIRLLHITILSLFAVCTMAQTNIDSLFSVAIDHSRAEEYDLAVQKAAQVVQLDSTRNDVKVFMANVYAWQQDYNTSKEYISQVYAIDPNNNELYETWLNVLLWNKEYKKLLSIIDTAKTNGYNNDYNLTLKKALAYQGLERYSAGINFLNQNKSLLDSADIRYLYNNLKRSASKNTISAFYSIDLFENNTPTPHHLAFVDYSTSVEQTIFIFRCNYAYRFEIDDIQPEIDIYHNFDNGHYLFANYGFGINNKLFPRHRVGLEYFFPFGNNFEASAGAKFFNYPSDDVIVLTGHLGKYVSNMWLSLRPYYTIKEGNNSFSSLFNMRIYDNNQVGYYGLELGYGNSPDDRSRYAQPIGSIWLSAYKIKLERNFAISHSNEVRVGAGYVYEEISQNSYRNRFLFEILLKHRF